MRRLWQIAWWFGGMLILSSPLWADNCGSLSDCYQTIKAATGVGVGIAILVTVGVLLDMLPGGGGNLTGPRARPGTMPQRGEEHAGSDNGGKHPGDELVLNQNIQREIELAWRESLDGQANVKEQGGWILQDEKGHLHIERWPEGMSAAIVPTPQPPNAVGHFHTHPYGSQEMFIHSPSSRDTNFTNRHRLPGFIRDRRGVFRIDPSCDQCLWEVIVK